MRDDRLAVIDNMELIADLLISEGKFEDAQEYVKGMKYELKAIGQQSCRANLLELEILLHMHEKGKIRELIQTTKNTIDKKDVDNLIRLKLIEASLSLEDGDADRTLGLANDVLKLITKNKTENTEGKIQAFLLNARAHEKKGKYSEAIMAAEEVRRILQDREFYAGMADMLAVIGDLYVKMDNFEKASDYFYRAGVAQQIQNLNESSTNNLKKALLYAEKTGNNELINIVKSCVK